MQNRIIQKKNNPLLDKYLEAWNTGSSTEFRSFIDFSFELRKLPDLKPANGIKNLEDYLIRSRTAIPDSTLKETEKIFVSNTAAIVYWNFAGTLKGGNDLPIIGSKIDISGFSIIFFNGSKLTGEWIAFGDLTWVK